ncbi:MAG: 3-oxoacyl-(acyl-carrier-protein) synthase, partial [Planctomycetota bacterium]
DAKGIIHSIKNALSSAGISSKEVDYINTHGTATLNNDSAEIFGISELFEDFPPFNSTKSYTGHTLAAAGALEAIFSILSLNNNELYKSLNVNTPIEPYNKFPIKEYQQVANLKTALSNSFGFAGNCTSLIIQKCI